jgi:hypothetical protein
MKEHGSKMPPPTYPTIDDPDSMSCLLFLKEKHQSFIVVYIFYFNLVYAQNYHNKFYIPIVLCPYIICPTQTHILHLHHNKSEP